MEELNKNIADDSDVNSFLAQNKTIPGIGEIPNNLAAPEEVDQFLKEEKYGTVGQQLLTGLEGAASAATFGLSTGVQTALGADKENILARREVNPVSHVAGQLAGLVGSAAIPGVGAANLMERAGVAGAKALGLGTKGAGIAEQIGTAATKAAIENTLFQAGDEVSKMMASDPRQSVETAVTNIGIASFVGAGVGGAIGAVSPLWRASIGERGGKFLEDFKGRIDEHLNNPEPHVKVQGQLEKYYGEIKEMADSVYGASGLKSQEIQKLMPALDEKIIDQSSNLISKLDDSLKKLGDDQFAGKLESKITEYKNAINSANSAGEIFEATQNMKQQLQEWGKFNKHLVPLAEKDFRQIAKDVGYEFRVALEEPKVWGKAAERQQSINKAFKEFLPTLEDFERKFTTEIAGERVIDPGKVNTYMNQLGKSNAEVKQEMLKNFLNKAEDYKSVIGETHVNLGIENPLSASEIHAVEKTLNEVTAGQKLADAMVRKGLAGLGGSATGAAVGGAAGHTVGAGGIGALIGEHALGPFFSSILPYMAKPLLTMQANSAAFKSAVEYGLSVVKGNMLINRAADKVFQSGGEPLPNIKNDEKQRNKIDKKVAEIAQDPTKLIAMENESGYYMPDHATAMTETAGRVVQYLSQIKPSAEKKSIFDSEAKPSQMAKANYNRALDIAEQPLVVLNSIKDGNLTPQDVTHMRAMYPALYQKLSQKLMDSMIEHVSKDNTVPYKQRLSLSLFLGQPLDSTMTQMGIAGAQVKGPVSSNQQQMPQMQSPAKGSLAKIDKSIKMTATPDQARLMEKSLG